MYPLDAKFNRFGGLGRKHNVVQFKIRDKTSPSIIGITTKPTTSCSSSSNSSIDPFDFPPPVKPLTVAPEETNIFDFPDTEEEALEVKLMVASLRPVPQNETKPKKKVSPANTPRSLSSTTNFPKTMPKSNSIKSTGTKSNSPKSNSPKINTKKPLSKVAALKKRTPPAPLSNQTNAHIDNNIVQRNCTHTLGQMNRQQPWSLQLSQQQLMQQQREQLLLQQQRERIILEQQIQHALLQQQREQERQQRQNDMPQQQQLLCLEALSKKQQESNFDIFEFDYNPKITTNRHTKSTSSAGPSCSPKLVINKQEAPKNKRKRNVVAHLKTARGETAQPVYFDFLSDEEEPLSDLLPLREIKERSRSPELTYAEQMELQLEAMTQETVIPISASKRVEYKPQNQMKVKFTFSKK